MLTAPDWALGSRYLRENAPELIPFIEKYGPCNLQPEAPEKYFGTLVTGIISQQLPPDVSLAMVKRLEETVGTPITPEAIASAAESDLWAWPVDGGDVFAFGAVPHRYCPYCRFYFSKTC